VIIRFATADVTIIDSTGASSSSVGGDTVLTWNTSGSFEFALAAAGPANLKSYNTNLKANIKTMNTNPIANVKTFDTNA
jgi:hypothetical protein